MTTLLVDADIVLFRSAAAVEREINWGDGIWTLHSSEPELLELFFGQLEKTIDALEVDDVYLCFSCDKRNFRKEFCSYYKLNRSNVRKPLAYKPAREYILKETEYECRVVEGLEADDILGIMGTNPRYSDVIIWSLDKDLKQIPNVRLFNGEELSEPTNPDDADFWFFKQSLIGDPTDGYKGCPGVGDKTADKILSEHYGNPESLLECVLGTYAKKKLSEDYAREQLQLARILRYGEYSFKTQKPILKYLEPLAETACCA